MIITDIAEKEFSVDGCSFAGFIISLETGEEIKMGIGAYQDCCENWGYFMTNDNVDDFIGATVSTVSIVDSCLNVEKLEDTYDGNVMFVNVETSNGTLQFTAYNEHNGYYSHAAVVISSFLSASESL